MDREYFLEIAPGVMIFVQFKTDFLNNSQALTMAIADMKDNYEFYKERYLKWLKRN